jgi:hypothetical protein
MMAGCFGCPVPHLIDFTALQITFLPATPNISYETKFLHSIWTFWRLDLLVPIEIIWQHIPWMFGYRQKVTDGQFFLHLIQSQYLLG